MSGKLYAVGTWVFKHRWSALALWAVAIALVAALSTNFNKPYDPSLSIPGTEAQQAIDKLSAELPQASNGSVTVVFAAPVGGQIIESTEAIDKTVEELANTDGVAGVDSPFENNAVSVDGRIAFTTVQLETTSEEVPDSVKESIEHTLEENRSSSLQIESRGDAAAPEDSPPIGELIGVGVAVVVLLITFSSLVTAGLPLLMALVTVGISLLAVSLATYFFNLSETTPILATMIGLAVGIDYSLFIIVRYIRNLQSGHAPLEATGHAIATAGNAVIFAAVTVIIALTALSVTGIPFLTAMGLAAAFAVLIAATAAITLLPALLSLSKFRLLKRKDRRRIAAHEFNPDDHVSEQSVAYRWASFLVNRPVAVLLITVVGLLAVAIPATRMQLGLPDDSSAASDSTQRKAYDLLSEGFGAGFNAPLLIVTDLPGGLSEAEQQASLESVAANLNADSNVAVAVPIGASPSGALGILQAYPKTGPNDTATRDLIKRIREDSGMYTADGSALQVSGSTAIAIDIDAKLAEALPVYIAVVIGLSLLVLLAVFRSTLIPIKATAGFLLTIFATFGLLVMIYQWGWLGFIEPGPILSFLPILATGILFGLAMDYQFFLVSGMREEYAHDKQKSAKLVVVHGFTSGAKVVTIAAIIMISVFTGFIFAEDNTIGSIGFALAVGILIDAFIVRMTIVPAVMALFGKRAWWLPGWLARILPNLSVEGSGNTPASKE